MREVLASTCFKKLFLFHWKNTNLLLLTQLRFLKTFFTKTSQSCLLLQNSGESCDAFVNIAGEKIFFHRAVICAHTKPFAACISSAKDDDMTDVLGVTGMEPDAFRGLLKFIYYGDADISPLLACDCAPFAKRFEAFDLQRITESVIAHNISANNVLPILKVAYLPENMDRAEMAFSPCPLSDVPHPKCCWSVFFIIFLFCFLIFLEEFFLNFYPHTAVNLDPLMDLDIRISVDILRAWQKTVM